MKAYEKPQAEWTEFELSESVASGASFGDTDTPGE